MTTKLYSVAGLAVRSDIAVPEFWPLEDDGTVPDLYLRVGDVPKALPGGTAIDEHCQAAGEDLLLTFGEIRFLIRGEREIVVAPGGHPDFARAALLADPLATVFRKRGFLPLHASAVEVAGRAVAFAAPAGYGKSTLLAGLCRRGYPMLCDDLCVVGQAAGGFVTYASFPIVKLCAEAADAADPEVGELLHGHGKQVYRVRHGFAPGARPLAAVYALRWSRRGRRPTIRRLARFEAFKAMAASIFYGALLPRRDEGDPLMAASAELVRSVDGFALARPRDLDRLDDGLDLLERDFDRIAAPGRPA